MDTEISGRKTIFFGNTENAFRNKDNKELKRSLWLFKLMGNSFFVKLVSEFTLLAIKIGLPVSSALKATIYKQFCAGESIEESQKVVKKLGKVHVGSILDYSVEGKEREEDFERTKNEIIKIIHLAKENPAIPYTSLKLTGILRFALLEKLNEKKNLFIENDNEYKSMMNRLHSICRTAFENDVPIYFDAEESWIQGSIDDIAEAMTKQYNSKKAIVLTTLQMYRWDRIDYLKKLVFESRKNNFFIGIKLVRGAYLEKENKRALQMGYKSPIQTSKEATDRAFDEAVDICLENIDRVILCAGTHNEASTIHLIEKMKALKIPNDHPSVYFSQLYGMSDHITFNLADAGYNVTKYLPYGPVKSTVPYLIRRAEENTAIAGQMSRELKLILEEKQRRKTARLLPAGK